MTFKPITGLAIAALLIATACAREAGFEVDEGGFGNPTMNNIDVQVNGYVLNLNTRFSSEVPTTVNFGFDQTSLDSQAQSILRQQAEWIKQFPEARFSVFGFTDLVGSAEYNYQLGLRRANTVIAFLESQGISRSRLEAKVSFGKTQPLVMTNNRDRRNRRAVTEVSGFVENHPNVLNGKYAEVVWREYVGSATQIPVNEASGLSDIASGGT